MLRVGLTGAVASGKSTVAEHLSRAGFPSLDADRVVHGLYEEDAALVAGVLERFPEVENERGGIDRRKLGAVVFESPDQRRVLESIVHPRVMEYIFKWFDRQENCVAAVVEAALWHRVAGRKSLDLLITVLADPAVRKQRLMERGLSPEAAEARLHAQGDMPHRESPGHWVVDNNGPPEALARRAADLVERIHALAERQEGEV